MMRMRTEWFKVEESDWHSKIFPGCDCSDEEEEYDGDAGTDEHSKYMGTWL